MFCKIFGFVEEGWSNGGTIHGGGKSQTYLCIGLKNKIYIKTTTFLPIFQTFLKHFIIRQDRVCVGGCGQNHSS